jgi:hypothetical protein
MDERCVCNINGTEALLDNSTGKILVVCCMSFRTLLSYQESKVKLSLYGPWRPLGLREVEAPTFSDIRLIDVGNVVSPTRRPRFTPRNIPGTHFC